MLGFGAASAEAAINDVRVIKQEGSAILPRTQFGDKPIFSSTAPVLLEADEIDYQQDNGIVIASGNVAISQGDTVLLANMVAYDQEGDLVIAKGNISMLDPSGNVTFADEIEMTHDLKEGIIQQFKARFNDDSVLVAARAKKIDENKTELFKLAYSPCLCADEKTQEPITPLWKVTSTHALVDQEEQVITYDNTFFSIYGVPIFYTPYFSHATPGANNKSGFLIPEYQHNNNVGTIIKVPFYYAIAPDRDATLIPIHTSEKGLVMAGEYRQIFNDGLMRLSGSITQARDTDAAGNPTFGQQIRGNIDGTGIFKIDADSNWGFDIHRTTDDTYLRLYDLDQNTLLTSEIYWERFNFLNNNRSYMSVQGLAFQGLTAQDAAGRSPAALPLTTFSYQSDPLDYNSRFLFDGNLLSIYRRDGARSQRLSTTTGWKLPYITDNGQIIEFNAQMRGDIYYVHDVLLPGGNNFNGTTGRLVPQISGLWRYPFINRWGDDTSALIEPVVMVAASPSGGNPDKIPNEDSGVPEFTDTNLFDPNRFAGSDRIENGPRVSYGLRGQVQAFQDKYLDWLFGQNYRVINDRHFPFSNDPSVHYSDYVGKIGITSHPVSLAYRFRMDQDNFSSKRDEVIASYSQTPFRASLSYFSLNNDPILADKKAVTGSLTVNLSKQWSWDISSSKDLVLHQSTGASTGLTFQNECAIINASMIREYTRDRDIRPSTSLLFRISLKNLD